jgi:hypothetical protein
MPITNDDKHLELNIGAAARVARTTHESIHIAMVTGALPHHRDRDNRRVVKLGDLLVWMRNVPAALAAE